MIDHNREALLRLVVAMIAMVGVSVIGVGLILPPPVQAAALRLLGPAEAATRRLILILSLRLPKREASAAKRSARAFPKDGISSGSSERIPPFRLFDPRKFFAELVLQRRPRRGPGPQISSFDEERYCQPAPPPPNTAPDPARLLKRLLSLKAALEDLPKQARRLARVQSRRRAAGECLRRTEPMRPGFPPGHRHVPTHEVDDILADCHYLALLALAAPNTS